MKRGTRVIDIIDLAERYTYLDNLSILSREGLHSLTSFKSSKDKKSLNKIIDLLVYYGQGTPVNWDVSLRRGNIWFDRIAEAHRKPTRFEQKKALKKIKEDLGALEKTAAKVAAFEDSLLENPEKALSERLGQVLLICLGPESLVASCVNHEDRVLMRFELDKLAFALAAYRAENGSYPARLADLVPKYVVEVPKDIFTNAELHYRREGDGFLLYSVGINGRDNGAKTYEDQKKGVKNKDIVQPGEDWDDLVVRIKGPVRP